MKFAILALSVLLPSLASADELTLVFTQDLETRLNEAVVERNVISNFNNGAPASTSGDLCQIEISTPPNSTRTIAKDRKLILKESSGGSGWFELVDPSTKKTLAHIACFPSDSNHILAQVKAHLKAVPEGGVKKIPVNYDEAPLKDEKVEVFDI